MKKSLKILCSFLITAISATTCFSQFHTHEVVAEDSLLKMKAQLLADFGKNKTFETKIELECLTALSFFPELKNTVITFKFGKPVSTMISRPEITSIFKRKSKREYLVIIRSPNTTKTGFEWTKLNYNALVGWIGHELSHIVMYQKKTNAGLLFTGIRYIFPSGRMKIEKETDVCTIWHGLGQALFDGTYYTLFKSEASENYKRKLRKYYLLPEDIIKEMSSTETPKN